MRRLKLVVIACALTLTFTGCGKENNENNQAPPTATEKPQAPTEVPTPTETPTIETDTREHQEVIDEILTAVKEAYGENYAPVLDYDTVSMEEYFGVKAELYDAYTAQGPMMTAHIDTFVAVHATDGNVKAVEDALNAFRDVQINDTFQYPSNMFKIQASKVITREDYVFFITLGFLADNGSGLTEPSQYIEAFEEQNQIAIDAIDSVLSE